MNSSKMHWEDWTRRLLDSSNEKYAYWVLGHLPSETIQRVLLPDHQHDWGGKEDKSKWLIPVSDTPVEEVAERYSSIKNVSEAKECISKIENLQTAIKNGESVGPLFLEDNRDCCSFRHVDCVHRAIAYSLLARDRIEFVLPIAIIATNDLDRYILSKTGT